MIGGRTPTIMHDPETVKVEWPELGEENAAQQAQINMATQVQIAELEKELKEAWDESIHYRRVINVLQESGAVTPSQVRKAHDLVREVGK